MTPINIKQVQIKSFKQEVKNSLTYGDVIYFQGKGAVTEIKGSDNQDGTQNVTYQVKVSLSDVKKASNELTKVRAVKLIKHLKSLPEATLH